jgi:hypothetical protein
VRSRAQLEAVNGELTGHTGSDCDMARPSSVSEWINECVRGVVNQPDRRLGSNSGCALKECRSVK